MRVLNNLNISGSIGIGSSEKDSFTIGTPNLENIDVNTDTLKVWANADFKNDVILGSNQTDTIFVSGTIKNNGGASLTGSFSGSAEYLSNITSSNIQNFTNDVRKQLSGIGVISYNPYTGEISYAGAGGDIYTDGNITGSGTALNPIRTKENITGSSITASVGISSSYFYGDGSNLTNLPGGGSTFTGGNITGSGTSGNPIGIVAAPIFNSVTSSNYTGSSLKVNYVDFVPNTPTFNIGRLYYDTVSEVLKFNLPYENTELNIGKQLIAKVKNVTGQQIDKGKVVYVNGAQGGSEILYVTTASWENDSTSAYTFGFTMSDLANNEIGYVILEGILEGVNTSGYSAGSLLYLSSSGNFTTLKPTQPNHAVRLGYVAREQNNNGSIFVRIQNGYELDELHDILITSPQNYDLLVRDTDGLWKNTKNIAGNYTFSGNSQFTGSLFGTSSYSNNTEKFDGQTSSLFALKSDVTGAVSNFSARSEVSGAISSSVIDFPLRTEVSGVLTASYAQLSANNFFTGINTFEGFTGSSAFISGDVRINGTASVAVLNTLNQNSLNVGDKYIIILSGAVDHPSLDSSGILWGSGAVGEATQGPLGEMAYIRYYAADDQLEVFPGLKVSGSITASNPSLFTQITSSAGFSGRVYHTASYSLDSDKLDGLDSSQFAKIDVNNNFTQPNRFTQITSSVGQYFNETVNYSNYSTRITPASASFITSTEVLELPLGPNIGDTFINGGQITSSVHISSSNFYGDASGLNNSITLTTNGITGSATFSGRTLNIPTYTSFIPPVASNEIPRGYFFTNNSTAVTSLNIAAPTAITSAPSTAAVATTNTLRRQARAEYRTVTPAAGRVDGFFSPANCQLFSISGSGFRFTAGFGTNDATTNTFASMFIGYVTSSTSPSAAGSYMGTSTSNITSSFNILGIGSEPADSFLSIISRGASGPATKISLGSPFFANKPGSNAYTDFYQVEFYNPANSLLVYYRVKSMETNIEVSGTLSTNLPATSALLGMVAFRTSGLSSNAVSLALSHVKTNSLS